MQILITHAGIARTRVLTLNAWQMALGSLCASVLLLALAAACYHMVFLTGAREGWPVVSQIMRLVVRDEFAQRDRFMRDNLDAMAQKVGEMQARLVRLEAMGERMSGMAGLKPEDLAPSTTPAPGGERGSSGGGGPRQGAGATREGAGGPFVAANRPSARTPEELGRLIEALDEQASIRSDVFTLIESRLFEKRLTALMVPSTAPVSGPVGSGFGFRSDPFSGRSALHTGLDFPADTGTPIVAAAGGMVLTATTHPQYGQMVELDHGNGLVTRYGHASKLLVRQGDLVKRGQAIAQVGSTGRSTGPHLHFEVLVEGVQQNPEKFLAAGPGAQARGQAAAALRSAQR